MDQIVGLATSSLGDAVSEAQASIAGLTTRVTTLEAGSATAAALATANAAIVALTQRVAALEGKPDPCVALSCSLPVATIQIGTADVSVAVAGLLSTDRIAVELMGDLPAGLTLGAIRPSPSSNGILLVQATATLSLTGKSVVPLAVTALR